jgi:hypothetical protein
MEALLGQRSDILSCNDNVIPGEKGGPAEPCSLQTIGFGEMSGAQIIDRKFSLQKKTIQFAQLMK